jgi:rhodanese-related sulfurtransferase
MTRLCRSSSMIVIVFVISACTSPYDFRDENRPMFSDTVTTDELASLQSQGAVVLDVRLPEDFQDDPVLIPGALYRNPDEIESWAGQMTPIDSPVVVYCVRGKWVSQKAATFLVERGFDVHTLEGGIEEWKAAGKPTAQPEN